MKIVVSRPPEVGDNDDGDDSDDEADGEDDDEELKDPDDMSPIDELQTFDWGSADDELAQFLAEDDGDGDGGGDGDGDDDDANEASNVEDDDATTESRPPSRNKRKHGDDTDTDGESSRGRSALSKKQRLTKVRSPLGLREVRSTEALGGDIGNLPTPQITGDEDDVMLLKTGESQDPVDKVDDVDEEFEADLLAEFEAEEAVGENG